MNSALFEAKNAPARLSEKNGEKVLVRTAMIDYLSGMVDTINEALARIPAILKKYGMEEYDSEQLQRDIVREGFGAVQDCVFARTVARLEQSGLFPQVRDRLARENMSAIPDALRDDLRDILGLIEAANRDLDLTIDFATLSFDDGKLSVPAEYRADIEPRYTLIVSGDDLETMMKIREAAALMKDLKGRGVQIGDEMRLSKPDNRPFLAPGLITRMASGTKYTDVEILSLLRGIGLNH